jgi:hemerythrin-like domain-containing protein
MVEKGIAGDSGPIAILLEEHENGRRRVRAIEEALELNTATNRRESIATVNENLQAYIAMLRKHVLRENEVLYPMADQLFTAQDEEELIQAFDQVEADEMGEGTHEKYHQMAHDLMHGK